MLPLLAILLLLVLPPAAALVLRSARCPGWAVAGGLLAGIVLGPTIFGRVLPGTFEAIYVGGVEERRDADVARMVATGAGTPAGAEGSESVAAWRTASRAHQRPVRLFVFCTVGVVLAGGGLLAIGAGERRQGWVAPASVGIWSAALPAAAVVAVATRGWGVEVPVALFAAATVAIGPWLLTPGDRATADEAEEGGAWTVQAAGRIASLGATALAVVAMWRLEGIAAAVGCLPLLGLPLGWLATGRVTRNRRAVRFVLECVLVPVLAASCCLRIDLNHDTAFWPVLLFVIVSGDGRWLGALIGALLPGGRRPLRTMRLIMGTMAAGPTQLAVVAIGVHTHTLPADLAVAAIAGALMIEVTAGARRRMATGLE